MAIQIYDPKTASGDIWILELRTGILSRVTAEPRSANTAEWSPDGRDLVYSSNRSGAYVLYRRVLGEARERAILPSMKDLYPSQWLRDGSLLLLNAWGRSLLRLAPEEGAKPETLLSTNYSNDEARVSPDGRWVVYNSEESGRWEVYLASFPGFSQRRQVSNHGGVQGCWRRDGKELFYLGLDGAMNSVQVKTEPTLESGIPRRLFQTRIPVNAVWDQYAVTGDGQRFLMFEEPESGARTFGLILNWPVLVKK